MPHRSAYYRWLLAAMLVALCVSIGYAFLAIPNVELFTATVFVAGYLTGSGMGSLIGLSAALLFSLLNPYGVPTPPLLAAQMLVMALAGAAGGWFYRRPWMDGRLARRMIVLAGIGFFLTLIYDVVTTFSFAILMAGGDMNKIWASFVYGMGFYGLHLFSNTVIFAVLVPLLIDRLRRIIKH